jgi:4-cresol dehydrogenase (hydroxylating)
VLLELARLDRIREVEETLAYVTVEPGVTFGQLERVLAVRGSRLLAPSVGSTPKASIVGNTVERGLTVNGPLADACAFEVVLPNGDLVRTGMSGIGGTCAPGAHRHGYGPQLDGLFTQSNFGIATALSLWLRPRMAYQTACYFGIHAEEQLGPLIERLRSLVLDGPIRPGIVLRNDYTTLAQAQQYPWGVLTGELFPQVALDRLRVRRFAETSWGCKWQGWINVDGCTREFVTASCALVSQTLSPVLDRLALIEQGAVDVLRWDVGDREKIREHLAAPQRPLARLAYWRKRIPIPHDIDPDRDGCGVQWVALSVPLTGEHITRSVRIAYDVMAAHEIEPCTTVLVFSGRAAQVTACLLFDRDLAGEDDRARSCHAHLLRETRAAGYPLRRSGCGQIDESQARDPELTSVLVQLKRSLDPNGVLAPGRYGLP